jgi:hypothetical protein
MKPVSERAKRRHRQLGGRFSTLALAASVVAASPVAASPPQPATACQADTRQGFFGNTIAQSLPADLGKLTSFEVRLGFTQPWSHPLRARLIRLLPIATGAVRVQVLAEMTRSIVGKPYVNQWARYVLPATAIIDQVPSASSRLAIELVDLPAGSRGIATVAWIRCGVAYREGALYATGHVFAPAHDQETSLEVAVDGDAAFRAYTR